MTCPLNSKKYFFAIIIIFLCPLSFAGQNETLAPTEEQAKALLHTNPNNYGLMNTLGSIYMNTHQYDKAEEQFKKIIALKPNFSPVYVNYGFWSSVERIMTRL